METISCQNGVRLLFVATVFFSTANCVSWERDLQLTLREKQTLDKFRDQVKPLLTNDFMKSDIYLIRWLRANSFNINNAEDMLKKNLRWRQERSMDTIRNEDFSEMFHKYPATVDTYDKTGRPVGVIDFYHWDIRKAVLSGDGPRVLRYLDMLMENVTTQVYERQLKGMNVTQFKVLGNVDGFSMTVHGCPICMPLWIQFLNSLENHFPGWMDELVAIEAPYTIHAFVDVLKPMLRKQTRDALVIFGTRKDQWMAYLDERVSRDQRRPAYGGTKPPVDY